MKVWITSLLISLLLPCVYISVTYCIISEKYCHIPSENCLQVEKIIDGELRLFATYEGENVQTIFDNNQAITITDWWKLRQLYLEGIGERTVFVNIS